MFDGVAENVIVNKQKEGGRYDGLPPAGMIGLLLLHGVLLLP